MIIAWSSVVQILNLTKHWTWTTEKVPQSANQSRVLMNLRDKYSQWLIRDLTQKAYFSWLKLICLTQPTVQLLIPVLIKRAQMSSWASQTTMSMYTWFSLTEYKKQKPNQNKEQKEHWREKWAWTGCKPHIASQ